MAEPKLTVADDMVVTLDYTLTLDSGEVADTTQGRAPLTFLAGYGQLLPAFEEAVMGLGVGDEARFTLSPEDGYGVYDEEAVEEVPIDQFPPGQEIYPGMAVGVQDASGHIYEAYIADISDDVVTLDFNHPLAGEALNFEVKVRAIRPATAEELAHGHVHDEEHHHD